MKKVVFNVVACIASVLAFWCVIFGLSTLRAERYEPPKKGEEKQTVATVKIVAEDEKNKEVVLLPIAKKKTEKRVLGEFVLTAYCSCEKCCGKWALNRPKDEDGNDIVYGASGSVLKAGVSVAVDPSVIPYGSKVYIDGVEYVAHDCGGAIKGNRIDVYFGDSHETALEFGKKTATVEILFERDLSGVRSDDR